ncbi:MAG: hypothetical protein ACKO5Z_03280, partial [Burkholderiaceae bacterium]
MLKKTLLLALCSVSDLSHAGWDIPIMTTAEVKYYADPETKRTSVLPSVWILADYDQPQHRADHDPD